MPPYVNQLVRSSLMPFLHQLLDRIRGDKNFGAGDLNYVFTKLLLAWLGDTPKYADYNAAIGVLQCCQHELYRRAIVPYEEQKQALNGDVFPQYPLLEKKNG